MSLDERIEQNRRELVNAIGGISDWELRERARRFNAEQQYKNTTRNAQVKRLCNTSYKFDA